MTTHSPFRCSNSCMIQRGANEVVLLDTGSNSGFGYLLNQTWKWNGTDWSTATAVIDSAGPLPTRTNCVMSYDGTNVVLYGGQGGSTIDGALQDTWLWNGTSWAKQTLTVNPFGRYLAEACRLTTASSNVIMFGGYGGQGTMIKETWDWNGGSKTWALQAPAASPSARIGHCMDGGTAYLVMFGGQNTNQLLNDTWRYDGNTWTQIAPATSPSCRTGASMAFDQTRNVWVMFGGKNYYNYLPETWTFNGTTWTQQAPVHSPAGLVWSQMCWDTQTGKVLLFGGTSATDSYPSSQTWAWSGTDWTQL